MAIFNQVVAGSGGGSGPTYYRAFEIDANGVLMPSTTDSGASLDFSGVHDIKTYYLLYSAYKDNTRISGVVNFSNLNISTYASSERACQLAFSGCTGITGVNLSSLTTTNGNQFVFSTMFYGCTNLTYADLSSLESISGNYACSSMFASTGLTTINFPKLKYIANGNCTNSMFKDCTNLTSAYMPLFYQIAAQSNAAQSMFENTGLITMRFESLKNVLGSNCMKQMFKDCTSLQSLWFYALASFGSYTNQFDGMLSGCTNVTVHFPMAIQSTIGSWSDVTSGFSGTNTTVLFDIVTSLTGADGNTYTRSEKDSTSTATAWDNGGTLYYTSGVSNNTAGVNEPSVSDAIYSDAACTQSVTTVASIA